MQMIYRWTLILISKGSVRQVEVSKQLTRTIMSSNSPGSGARIKPREFILGYPDEEGRRLISHSPQFYPVTAAIWPIAAWKNMGKFRDFLREHGETPEGQELIAAKLMGRWR